MSDEARKVLEQALRLPIEARLAVVSDLLASLDDADELAGDELARLDASIDRARGKIADGSGISAVEVLHELAVKQRK